VHDSPLLSCCMIIRNKDNANGDADETSYNTCAGALKKTLLRDLNSECEEVPCGLRWLVKEKEKIIKFVESLSVSLSLYPH